RERAGVAHENFCRVTIKPKKTESGTDERCANHRQFAGERIKRDLQIFRDPEISRDVRKQRVIECSGNGASDGKSIEPIGQNYRVRSANNYEREERNGKPG